jgi:ABC-2 type transport system permease protein
MTAASQPMGAARRAAVSEFTAAVRTIMVKELRSRFRGRRAFVILTVYLGLLALLAYGTYAVIAPSARQSAQFGGGGTSASASIGIAVFIVLSLFQLLLVCFIAPAFTTGAISLEREKQTLDLLISTPLRPGAIVVGKLLAALAYVGLMILAAIPISAIVFMYGGATVEDVVRQQVVLLVTALGLGAIGLFWSALVKRTQAATVLTYCTMLALTVGTVLVWGFWTLLASREAVTGPQRAPEQILWINPGVAMVDVVAETEAGGFGGWSGILNGIIGGDSASVPAPAQLDNGQFGGIVCKNDVCFDQNGNPIGGAAPVQAQSASGHFWPRFAISFAFLAFLATFLSMRLVVPAGMRFVFRRSAAQELAASMGTTVTARTAGAGTSGAAGAPSAATSAGSADAETEITPAEEAH